MGTLVRVPDGTATLAATAIEVRDDPDRERFEAFADGAPAGFAAYRRRPGLIAITHTEVEDRFEGLGVGSALAGTALDAARTERLAVLPFCPFVSGYLRRHPEHVDLVPAEYREQFGLA